MKIERKEKQVLKPCQTTKLWNIRFTVIPTVIGELGMILKDLEKGRDE